MEPTTEVFIEPSAILVDLADDVLDLCEVMLPSEGLKVHRVAHAHAACERIAVLLPQLVVVPVAMPSADLDLIEDRAIAVGATLLYLDTSHGSELVTAQLYETVKDVRAKFAGRRR